MRELKAGEHRFIKVLATDEPEHGACHHYEIVGIDSGVEFGFVKFQRGPVKEVGVNGCFGEDLVAILIDRLKSFQAGELACHENESALDNLKSALEWLNRRTVSRQARGVEGTSKQ